MVLLKELGVQKARPLLLGVGLIVFDQENIPDRAPTIGVGLVGLVFGFCASLTYVLTLIIAPNHSFWLALPLFFVSGALGMAAVIAASAVRDLLATRRRRGDPEATTQMVIGPQHSIPSASDGETDVNGLRSSAAPERLGHSGKCESIQGEDARRGAWGVMAAAAVRFRRIGHPVPEPNIVGDRAVSGAAGLAPPARAGGKKNGLRPRDGSGEARISPLGEPAVDRLRARLIEFRPEWVPGPEGVVGYLGQHDDNSLRAIAAWAGAQQDAFLTSSMDEIPWWEIDGLLRRAGVLFVDADSVGDAGETVDLCLHLRARSPNTPLILISSDVRDHDLTAERAAICDATLKKPLTTSSIERGISAAHRNASRVASRLQGASCL